MKRNVKKEVLTVGDRKISFMEFAQTCYKAQKRTEDFDFYVLKNKKTLQLQWDVILKGVADNHIKQVEKEKSLSTKLTEKVVKWIDKVFSPSL